MKEGGFVLSGRAQNSLNEMKSTEMFRDKLSPVLTAWTGALA